MLDTGWGYVCPAAVCVGPAATGQAPLETANPQETSSRRDRREARVSGQDSEGREAGGQEVLGGIRLQ